GRPVRQPRRVPDPLRRHHRPVRVLGDRVADPGRRPRGHAREPGARDARHRHGLRDPAAQHATDARAVLLRPRVHQALLLPAVLPPGRHRALALHGGLRVRDRARRHQHRVRGPGRGRPRARVRLHPDPHARRAAPGGALGHAAADQRADRAAQEHDRRRRLLGVRGRRVLPRGQRARRLHPGRPPLGRARVRRARHPPDGAAAPAREALERGPV
ncbi:MAG: ABC transporter, permease protein (cluster 3, basic aa/glutamine/opines), partial [uncultured Actinomycetospora sp.]